MRLTTIVALVSAARLGYAQLARYSPSEDTSISYSVNIPTSTSESGSGPIYFQIKGPTTKQWIALGQGIQMSGANIFVVYTDGNGNVTISPRSGRGYIMPEFNSDADVTLLEGSGVIDNQLIANVRCGNCLQWSGGEMQVKDTESNWIWSVKDGDPLDSTSQSETISQHDNQGGFNFDLTKATGGDSDNPFVVRSSPSPSGTPSGKPSGTSYGPSKTLTGSAPSSTSTGNDDDENTGSSATKPVFTDLQNKQKIHGITMGTAFVILFPLGAIIIRVLPSQKVNVHMTVQLVGYILAIVGLAYGVILGRDLNLLMEAHPIIGMVVVGGLFFQPIVGLIHHWIFKSKGKRTFLAPLHVYWGRSLVILGIINGGLGLKLAANTNSGKIAYAAVAGVMGLAWIGAVVFYYVRGDNRPVQPMVQKYSQPTREYSS